MNPKLRHWLIAVVCLLLVLGLLIALIPILVIPYLARQSFPQTEGEIHITSLDGPVDIYRDRMGIPHIYASTLHDLFFAQGYVHAQERFWQMDFWRHIGSGNLSEMFGKSQFETDVFLRTLGWHQIADQEYANLSTESQAILNAYADGVNAYLDNHTGAALSLEYALLRLLNPSYKPESWIPTHSLTWGKVMAWDLRSNMDDEIERSILLKTLTLQQVDELSPVYPQDHPVIVPQIGEFSSQVQINQASTFENDTSSLLQKLNLLPIAQNIKSLDQLLGPAGMGIGSNSWAVSGSHTTTGLPLLANDTHLAVQMPSIWFQLALHCQPKSDACPYEMAGFTFAGAPGVIIGHNDNIAWGFTNTGSDVMDLYIEKIDPANPNQYEVNGQWVDMVNRIETILVSGGEQVTITVRQTRHGPIISDTYGPILQMVEPEKGAKEQPKPYQEKAGINLPEHYAIALRWTALDPSLLFEAIWGFNKAKNWEEFHQSARKFTVATQNLLYADVDGNIAYQLPGNIPIRKNGDGTLPVPGWTDEYEWDGFIPFEELPYMVNPPDGYIVTANNQVNPTNYPYLINKYWDYGFRAQRITDMLMNAPVQIDIPYIMSMQGDNFNLNAQLLLPILLQLANEKIDPYRTLLAGWDYQNSMASKEATVFEYFWWFLLKDTFTDEAIPEDYWPSGGSRWMEVMRQLVEQPNNPWWDDQTTQDIVETRDQIFAKAFNDAIATLMDQYGKDPNQWPTWGKLHTVTFRNPTLGESGIAPLEKIFNRGPFPTAGGESIVNATGWEVFTSFEVNSLPSQRMIVNLGDLNNSFTVHTTGQSGHVNHPHYIDMVDLWRNIQYYPMLWDINAVTSAAEAHLTLLP